METNNSQASISRFKEGFSCSQAVLSAFSDGFGLEVKTALKISQPFGGGIARRGDICGAVSGACMVLGLKYGRTEAEDTASRDRTYEAVAKLIQRFERTFGSILCRELLGHDLSTDEGHRKAEEQGVFENLCPKFVQIATELVEDLINP